MKKVYTLLASVLIAGSAFAQRSTSETRVIENSNIQMPTGTEMVIDTVAPTIVCATPGVFLTGSSNGGYVAGTNGYGDLEKGVIMFPQSSYKITDLLVYVGAKEQVSGGSLVAYIYPVDTAAGSIGAAVATSDPVSVSSIDTSGALTEFSFSTPATLSNVYIMSVEVDNGGDTIGIVHTNDGCGGNTAVEKWSDGSWYAMADPSGWGLDVQFYIFAVTDDNISNEENVLSATTATVFPNPANESINLVYDLKNNAEVTISVMDIQGRVVQSMNEAQTAGGQRVEMNVSELSAGTYFYNIQSGEQTINGKFVVRH